MRRTRPGESMRSTSEISVLLASDIPKLRGSVVELLNGAQNVNVVACAESQGQVLPLAEAKQPQLAIVDLDIDWKKRADLVGRLSAQNTSVLLMSDESDMSQLFDLFVMGLRGILQRRISPDLMRRSVHAVAAGELWLSRHMAWRLVDHLRTQSLVKVPAPQIIVPQGIETVPANSAEAQKAAERPHRYGLTRRESEIVRAIGDAMTNKDIAIHFGISEYTVKHHLTRIFDKTGVDSRLELAMFAKHHGLVQETDGPVAHVLHEL
jgi:two-component system nitrate/nitrite response regulator NarL